jgi:hypothetical protein
MHSCPVLVSSANVIVEVGTNLWLGRQHPVKVKIANNTVLFIQLPPTCEAWLVSHSNNSSYAALRSVHNRTAEIALEHALPHH